MLFDCPGCRCAHQIKVGTWTWNGSVDAPTFTPSLLVNSYEMSELGLQQYNDHVNGVRHFEGGRFDGTDTVCHSFITDGKIQFLGDCTHEMAGQTIDLPEWE